MRFTVDTNILVYIYDKASPAKRDMAHAILRRGLDTELVLTVQVLGEFLNVIRRKHPDLSDDARRQVLHWLGVYTILPTYGNIVVEAFDLARRRELQFWDSVIIQAARQVPIDYFLTEDMHDGLDLNGMVIVNPFQPENAGLLEVILAPSF